MNNKRSGHTGMNGYMLYGRRVFYSSPDTRKSASLIDAVFLDAKQLHRCSICLLRANHIAPADYSSHHFLALAETLSNSRCIEARYLVAIRNFETYLASFNFSLGSSGFLSDLLNDRKALKTFGSNKIDLILLAS